MCKIGEEYVHGTTKMRVLSLIVQSGFYDHFDEMDFILRLEGKLNRPIHIKPIELPHARLFARRDTNCREFTVADWIRELVPRVEGTVK